MTCSTPHPHAHTLLFRREFDGYTGGHGKVHDYFRHTRAHADWTARVHMHPDSNWVGNPWQDDRDALCSRFDPRDADALFLGGMDWLHYPVDMPGVPVINLVQGVRHADPHQPLFQFLGRRALRICVSQPVADAIHATGRVQGPVHVIEAGLHLPSVPIPARRTGIFIDALKQPALGRELADALGPHAGVVLSEQRMFRDAYLAALAAAEVAVLLPEAAEGFYLPALEAMALGCAVVVADCVGNRAYLQRNVNALVPDGLQSHVDAVHRLVGSPVLRARLGAAGRRTAAKFSIDQERAAFHRVLDTLDTHWTRA